MLRMYGWTDGYFVNVFMYRWIDTLCVDMDVCNGYLQSGFIDFRF